MSSEAMILKRDAGGRVVLPVERQIQLVGEYERSGLSGPKFAAMTGLKYQTFATWRRKYGTLPPMRRRSTHRNDAAAWMEAVVDTGSASALTLMLPGGITVLVSHPGQVTLAAQLLKTLAPVPC
jgi:hypothetical protein